MQDINNNVGIGSMDMDSEDRAIAVGDYKFAKNIRNAINAANRGSALTNVMGMVAPSKYLLPYNNNIFPIGTNKCIGAVEDTKFGTVIFFVWNSGGKHQILRYYPNITDPANQYGEIQQVMQYDFGWTKRTRITSASVVYGDPENDNPDVGDLLYWCDPVPKKINLTKGNVVKKRKSWTIQVPKTTTTFPALPVVTFKNFTGGTVYTQGYNLVDTSSQSAIIVGMAELINANPNSPVEAIACNCNFRVVEKVAGTVWTMDFDTPQILNYAENWYGADLIDRFFDRCKWQPLEAPQASYQQDANYEPNYVQGKVFQFRSEYIYDDREPSALGVWSQIPINNLGCDGNSDPLYNYILINFNDPKIIEPVTLVLLKKLRLIARELNTGKDRSVLDLTPCDYLDYIDGQWVSQYSFYNNIISSSVDDATAAKLFDDVPLESAAEVFKENRMIEGNCLTGYNPPDCIDASVQIDFGDAPNPKLYKITGLIRVFNYRMDNNGDFPTSLPPETTLPNILERRSPILYDPTQTYGNVAYPFFGGTFYSNSNLQIKPDFAFSKKRQYLPEGGWPVYAAGTNYFTISKQASLNNVAQRADGSIDVSGTVNQDLLKDLYDNQVDVYSTFELNVPAGEYVIRLASHWCSFGDKLGKGFMYNLSSGLNFQKTSTYTWGIVDNINGGYKYDFEIKVTVTNSDVFIGEFIVADLVFPNISDDTRLYPSHSGYLYDNFGAIDVVSLSQGVTVERALVRNTVFNESAPLASYQQKVTDHNGFFFTFPDVDFNSELTYANRFLAIQVNGIIHNTGTQYYENIDGESALALLLNQTITPSFPHDPIPSHLEIILPTDTIQARLQSSSFVTGTVVSPNNSPINNVNILITHGRYGYTATNGKYTVLIWGDMMNTPPFSAPVNLRNDYVIFNVPVSCQPIYPSGQSVFFSIDGTVVPTDGFGTNGTDTPPPYSPTAQYPIPDFIINEQSNPSVKAHKRGGNYTYGIRLYDNAGRLCTVVKAFEVYVPFITEDIGKYGIQDFNGNIYPVGTYKYGKPQLKAVLANTTVFEGWVSYMQWMRTKNTIQKPSYLQWVANQVTYLSAVATASTPEIQTVFQNADAVAIKISLSNITTYYAYNNNSQVGYNYTAGDRLRLIADRNIENYQGLYDFEITSYDSTTQSIIIKPEGFGQELLSGTLFEIFNPKSVATEDEQIFYEVGEVIPVTNGIPQSFSTVLTNGDTYWRGRTIIVNDEATKFAAAYPVVIESASVSDFYTSEAQDIGRIGIVDDNFRQVRRPMLLKASNQFIPSTAINGLSSFEALNSKELDRNSGTILRLLSINQQVVVVSSQREISNYIQVVTLQQATQGNGVIAVANEFFGTQYPHSKTLGSNHAGSVFINNGQIFGYHSERGDVFRYQGDGEDVVSDKKMKNYFKQLAKDGVTDVVGVYYRFTEEAIFTIWRKYQLQSVVSSFTKLPANAYVVTFNYPAGTNTPDLNQEIEYQYYLNGTWNSKVGSITNVTDTTISVVINGAPTLGQQINIVYSLPETISWFNSNELVDKKAGWQCFYDFTPEAYSQLGNGIVSFVNGRIWLHDKLSATGDYNKFYGVNYNSYITPVFNEQPLLMKAWQALWLHTRQSDGLNNWSAPSITNVYGQQSRLLATNLRKIENTFYADFKRDATTPNVTNPIVNGRVLRSEALSVSLENDYTGEVLLYAYGAINSLSARTKK